MLLRLYARRGRESAGGQRVAQEQASIGFHRDTHSKKARASTPELSRVLTNGKTTNLEQRIANREARDQRRRARVSGRDRAVCATSRSYCGVSRAWGMGERAVTGSRAGGVGRGATSFAAAGVAACAPS